MKKIRIRTKSGKIVKRNADVTDWIDNDGRQSSTASIGKNLYHVVDRDFYGAIFGK